MEITGSRRPILLFPYFDRGADKAGGGHRCIDIELLLGSAADMLRGITCVAGRARLGLVGANVAELGRDLGISQEMRPVLCSGQVVGSVWSLHFHVRKVGKKEFFPTFNPGSCK